MFEFFKIRPMTIAAALLLASQPAWAHPGEHGRNGVLATVIHFFLNHGYLAVGMLGVAWGICLLRMRHSS